MVKRFLAALGLAAGGVVMGGCAVSTPAERAPDGARAEALVQDKSACSPGVSLQCNGFGPGSSITGEVIVRNDSADRVRVEISPWNANTVVSTLDVNPNSAERYGWATWPQSCPGAAGLVRIKSCTKL